MAFGASARIQASDVWSLAPVGKVVMFSPQLMPRPGTKCRPGPIMPTAAVVSLLVGVSAPTASLTGSTGSLRCMTQR